MKRFGNVPVPDVRRPSDLKKLWRETKAALDNGVSLIVFAEGKRTLTGRMGAFEEGAFRMAVQFGCPIVPVSTVGSFEFNRKDRWWVHPSNIVVHIHDTIETAGMKKSDVDALIERVRAIMTAPVDAYYDARESKEGMAKRCGKKLEADANARQRAPRAHFLPGVNDAMNHGDGGHNGDYPQHRRHAIK